LASQTGAIKAASQAELDVVGNAAMKACATEFAPAGGHHQLIRATFSQSNLHCRQLHEHMYRQCKHDLLMLPAVPGEEADITAAGIYYMADASSPTSTFMVPGCMWRRITKTSSGCNQFCTGQQKELPSGY